MEQEILNYLNAHKTEIFHDLRQVVEAQASTDEIPALHACRAAIEELIIHRTGIKPQLVQCPAGHDIIYFEYGSGDESILLSGHYDTVHPAGSFTYHEDDARIMGPGVYDMKSGLVSIVWVIHAFIALGIKPGKKMIVVFNGDEETGSEESTDFICKMARGTKAALVAEPSTESGDLKTGRKGMLKLHVSIFGRESHSGNAYSAGINALEELAHEILYAQSLTNYDRGVTVNVGIARGGNRINVVPGFAEYYLEVRALKGEHLEMVADAINQMEVKVPGATRKVEVLLKQSPMEETGDALVLFDKARQCGERLGLSFSHQVVGGIGDANSIAALKIPVLDGLGAVGGFAHSPDEFIWKDKYIPRISLLASLILSI
nr:M20/M25/M40 family metallo-hydrolase [Clostridia bacterium]